MWTRAFLVLITMTGAALARPELPTAKTGYVHDYGRLLADETEKAFTARLSGLAQKHDVSLVLLTLSQLAKYGDYKDSQQIADALYQASGVENLSAGRSAMIVVTHYPKDIAISGGGGFVIDRSQELSALDFDEAMRLLENGNTQVAVAAAVITATDAVASIAQAEAAMPQSRRMWIAAQRAATPEPWWFLIVVAAMALYLVVRHNRRKRICPECGEAAYYNSCHSCGYERPRGELVGGVVHRTSRSAKARSLPGLRK